MTTLPIHERFLSFQGEGIHAGCKAFFIRTMGCPLHCPWCDSAGTWHKDWVPSQANRIDIDELCREASEAHPEFVVITGGEPCIHDNLTELVSGLQRRRLRVHLETSGAFPQPDIFNWVTVSPKRAKPPLHEMMKMADEIKLIVDETDAIPEWLLTLRGLFGDDWFGTAKAVLLHPEWSKRNDPHILTAITRSVVCLGHPFRAGWQMHKLYHADAGDSRSAASSPLGGNPSLGSSI